MPLPRTTPSSQVLTNHSLLLSFLSLYTNSFSLHQLPPFFSSEHRALLPSFHGCMFYINGLLVVLLAVCFPNSFQANLLPSLSLYCLPCTCGLLSQQGPRCCSVVLLVVLVSSFLPSCVPSKPYCSPQGSYPLLTLSRSAFLSVCNHQA